jgi:hypothetical protein
MCVAAVLGVSLAGAATASISVTFGSGANPPALQAKVDEFRAILGGANNGVGGSFASGRREINWDGVPDSSALPNFLAPDFFNVNSPRGVVFSALEYETGTGFNGFMVSADSSNPTSTPIEFADIDLSYITSFQPFSSPRLFHARNAAALDVLFFVPGTTTPAVVSGFGVVFADVDGTSGGDRTIIRCYGTDGSQEIAAGVPAFNNGLSFVGLYGDGGERFARCNIEFGNRRLASGVVDGANGVDVVALDDFIYGEPRSIFTIFEDGFDGR